MTDDLHSVTDDLHQLCKVQVKRHVFLPRPHRAAQIEGSIVDNSPLRDLPGRHLVRNRDG